MSDQPTAAPGKGAMAARDHLAQRLIDRHGIDPSDAFDAVTLVYLGITDGPHAELVGQEARAVLTEAMVSVAAALTPIVRAVQEAMRTLGASVQRAMQATRTDYALAPPPPGVSAAPRARDGRPPWQTPYGPPTRRH